MAKVILFKNNKGGVGKSLLCFWTGHLLTKFYRIKDFENNKVLIITSDSQNNIMEMAGAQGIFSNGLQGYMENKGHDLIKLRENLFYIPLKDTQIKRTFESKFMEIIEVFKKQYDYILIDGSPVLKLDDLFLEISDKVVIPTYLDRVTTKGMINLIGEVGVDKIAVIVPNRVGRTKVEREHLETLREKVEEAGILVTNPLYQSSKIMKLIEKSKTIRETNSKQYEDIRRVFVEVLKAVCDEYI